MDKICVTIDPGICGFSCQVKAWQKDKRLAGFEILGSQCKLIQKLAAGLDEITFKDFFLPLTKNPIFISAERAGCHLACPVPCAIVKSVEAALGLALPKDVSLRIEKVID